jgi:hypothetical protein
MATKKQFRKVHQLVPMEKLTLAQAFKGEVNKETPETIFVRKETEAVREAIVLVLLTGPQKLAFCLRYNLFGMGRHSPSQIGRLMNKSTQEANDMLLSAAQKIHLHHEEALRELDYKSFMEKERNRKDNVG